MTAYRLPDIICNMSLFTVGNDDVRFATANEILARDFSSWTINLLFTRQTTMFEMMPNIETYICRIIIPELLDRDRLNTLYIT